MDKVNTVTYKTRWIVGLTGQSGAGKTLISQTFENFNFGVINCDEVARYVTQPMSECVFDILFEFPECVDEETVTLDRRALAEVVFSDREKLDALNKLIFRYIKREINHRIGQLVLRYQFIMLDAPTLFESGLDKRCDYIISVTADEDIRLKRIMERDGLDEASVRKRFASQLSQRFFETHSNYVIRNNTTPVDAMCQAQNILYDMTRGKG